MQEAIGSCEALFYHENVIYFFHKCRINYASFQQSQEYNSDQSTKPNNHNILVQVISKTMSAFLAITWNLK
jgi:hypothetical protein